MSTAAIKSISADGVDIFYREAGPKDAPVILLLHGFPTSSHQFRNLIPILSKKYHIYAPDMPAFGFTVVPTSRQYVYNFSNITTTIIAFLDALYITKFSMYIFDYGAPVGLRIALERPEAVSTIITQNGNAYEEGLGERWSIRKEYWRTESAEIRSQLRPTFETIKGQYLLGEPRAQSIAPESYWLDYGLISRPGNLDIQLDLLLDYRENVELYPKFQEYFRKTQVPLLAVWGKNDISFIAKGAEAFRKDLPESEIHLLDGGHFVLESETEVIGGLMLKFLARHNI